MISLNVNRLILLFFLLCLTHSVEAKPSCIVSKDEQNIANCHELANNGEAAAQNTLGLIYYQDALFHQGYHTKARILFEQAANQGLAEAQYNLGAMYRDELNNFPVALSWFEKAAAQGNLDAVNSIGYIYENGDGGDPPQRYMFDENGKNNSPDIAKNIADYAIADNRNYLPSNIYPRSLYPLAEFGQGVEQNYTLAAQWYQQAAEQGHALAQTNLAYLYLMGLGVDKDEQKAVALYQQAAAQDCVPALNTLGFLYVQGMGTEVDVKAGFASLVKAYQLQPNDTIDMTLFRLQRKAEYQGLGLTASLAKVPTQVYPKRFELDNASEEDYLFGQLSFLRAYYHLNLFKSEIPDFANVYYYNRPTKEKLNGFFRSERLELWVTYSLKQAIQGRIDSMLDLSYYYRGWGPDIERSKLWKQYAINIGRPE